MNSKQIFDILLLMGGVATVIYGLSIQDTAESMKATRSA